MPVAPGPRCVPTCSVPRDTAIASSDSAAALATKRATSFDAGKSQHAGDEHHDRDERDRQDVVAAQHARGMSRRQKRRI